MKRGLLVLIISQLLVAIGQPVLSATDVTGWDTLSRAASRERKNKQYPAAERLYQKAIDACDNADLHRIIDSRINLASVLLDAGRTKEASQILTSALSDCQKTGRRDSAAVLRILRRLDRAWGESNPSAALEMDREAVSVSERLFGNLSPSTIDATERLCFRLEKQGQFEESLRRSQSMLQRLKQKGHTSRSGILIDHMLLCALPILDGLCGQSKFQEAFSIGKTTIDIISGATPAAKQGPVLIRTAAIAMTLCGKTGFEDPQIASDYETLTLTALKLRGDATGPDDNELVHLVPPLSDYYLKHGQSSRAIALCRKAIPVSENNPNVSNNTRAYLISTLARPLIRTGKLSEAEQLLMRSRLSQGTPAGISDNVLYSIRQLTEVYVKENQRTKAEQLLDKLQRSGSPRLNSAIRSLRSEFSI